MTTGPHDDSTIGPKGGQGGEPGPDALRRTRAEQARLIKDMIDDVEDWPQGSSDTGDVQFFYRRGALLVRDWNRDNVIAELGRQEVGVEEPEDLPGSLTRLWLTTDEPVPSLVRRLESESRGDVSGAGVGARRCGSWSSTASSRPSICCTPAPFTRAPPPSPSGWCRARIRSPACRPVPALSRPAAARGRESGS